MTVTTLKYATRAIYRYGALMLLTIAVATGAAVAADETQSQRNACRPDVFRLCKEFIPDRDAITACLQRNTSKLSDACRGVFTEPPKKR